MKRVARLLVVVVGIVISAGMIWADEIKVGVSVLPKASHDFLSKHFGVNNVVHEVEFDNIDSIYSVELRNGYDIKFCTKGNVVEVESPNRNGISVGMVKDLLPANAISYLKNNKLLDEVDEISKFRDGSILVEIDRLTDDLKLWFDKDGNLVNRTR